MMIGAALMEKMSLTELVRKVNIEIVRLEYTQNVIRKHVKVYQRFLEYAIDKGIEIYSEELGERFLLDAYELVPGKKSSEYNSEQAYSHAAIRKLGEYQTYGAFGKLVRHGTEITWALDDKLWIEEYDKSLDLLDVSKKSKFYRRTRIQKFYNYLGFQGLSSATQTDADLISQYVISIQCYSKTYVRHLLKDLRSYFRFLYSHGHIKYDLSQAVPRICVPESANVPALWTEPDINKLLSCVDRSTPIGKRDYAVLLIITGLGLRSCDVRQIKLDNLNWQRKEIEIVQSKTGVMNICPMTDELGWAIIDYIRYSRQKSDLPYLFLTANAPYTQFGSSTANHILRRYIDRCGIPAKPMGVSRGSHSLRHAFARKLLNQNVSLELISEILGHTALTSASPYLKIDIEGLRECALSIGEVKKYAEQADV